MLITYCVMFQMEIWLGRYIKISCVISIEIRLLLLLGFKKRPASSS